MQRDSNLFEMFCGVEETLADNFEMPFECEKQTTLNENEDSTHDSQCTNSCEKRKQFTFSPTNSDLEDLVNDMKMEKLMQDLDFID